MGKAKDWRLTVRFKTVSQSDVKKAADRLDRKVNWYIAKAVEEKLARETA